MAGTIELDRLRSYTLSPTHERGADKARVWEAAFGIRLGDEELLRRLIREQLRQTTLVE